MGSFLAPLCLLVGLLSPPPLAFCCEPSSLQSGFAQPAAVGSSCGHRFSACYGQGGVFHIWKLLVSHWKDNKQRLGNKSCYKMVIPALSHGVVGRKSASFQKNIPQKIF